MDNFFSDLEHSGFDVLALHHAKAILTHDMPEAVRELHSVLKAVRLPLAELVAGGGGETKLTQRLRQELTSLGWKKHIFEIRKIVDGRETESQSHEIDHVKWFAGSPFALEIEWNNKDPFFDRDLENFKRLHAEGAISVGCIITRGRTLHEGLRDLLQRFAEDHRITNIETLAGLHNYRPTARQRALIAKRAEKQGFARGWAEQFVADKFGEATTHWRKLEDRVRRGVGNPCPLLLIGLPKEIVVP